MVEPAQGTNLGEAQFNDYMVTGLPGAVATTRYVGATVESSPASGTFLLGDYVIDQTGGIWVCIQAGSPGLWAPVGAVIPVISIIMGITLSYYHDVVLCSGTMTVSLPSAALNLNRQYMIKNIGTGLVTLNTVAGLLDNMTSITFDFPTSVTVISDGANWWIL